MKLIRSSVLHAEAYPLFEDHNAIDSITRHLKLSFAAERPPPPQAQPQLAMAAEEKGGSTVFSYTRMVLS